MTEQEKSKLLPMGVVLERRPGATRWAKWAWRAVAVLPGAGAADWKLLRDENGVTSWHVGTYPLDLHWTEVESYRTSLMMTPPSIFVVMVKDGDAANEHGIDVHTVTISADRAMEHQDSGELIVEPVPMPEGLISTIAAFCEAHYVETEFKKRKRDRARIDLVEDGKGDPRIRQATDVFRSPAAQKTRQNKT